MKHPLKIIAAMFLLGLSACGKPGYDPEFKIALNAASDAGYEGRHQDAVDLLKPFAEAGDVDAQVHLGHRYATYAFSVSNDVLPERHAALYGRHLYWMRQAAKAGNGPAMAHLAEGLYHGDVNGTFRNRQEAHIWIKRAAALDDARTYEQLGNIHATDTLYPSPQEVLEAYRWYSLALNKEPKSHWPKHRLERLKQKYPDIIPSDN